MNLLTARRSPAGSTARRRGATGRLIDTAPAVCSGVVAPVPGDGCATNTVARSVTVLQEWLQ